MEYIVKFDFNCVKNAKAGLAVTGMSGEVNITADCSEEELRSNPELIQLIADDMAIKTRKDILSVDITSIIEA